jgi:hypothetical protein
VGTRATEKEVIMDKDKGKYVLEPPDVIRKRYIHHLNEQLQEENWKAVADVANDLRVLDAVHGFGKNVNRLY